ncbi:hypothetical protein Salat_0958100 [Sesamum alatum]|uniref:Uncharacterized protein n=1 Tax=Sesamum alatum TaxID=300844 RepID=A0AAE2CRL9_9LAMI|nr:hypothetical protein Salat_0958100 [Sesamum alatum]
MDDTNNVQHHTITNPPNKEQQEEEEDDDDAETLSLCDFPLNSGADPDKRDSSKAHTNSSRRSSSEPSDFFEFFNDFTSEMSHAEDIIFCGKLVPTQPHLRPRILKSLSEHDAADFSRRYCHSFPELNPTRPTGVASTRLPRGGRSLDGKRFRRRSSALLVKPEPSDIHRSLSKSSAKSEGSSSSKVPKPRWFVLMFGPLRLQQEMDLRDMKNRQVRRNPGSMFPGVDGGGGIPVGRRSSWGHDLLRVLSCKNHASVAVTASIGLVPHF